jgi:hypothetical protein
MFPRVEVILENGSDAEVLAGLGDQRPCAGLDLLGGDADRVQFPLYSLAVCHVVGWSRARRFRAEIVQC